MKITLNDGKIIEVTDLEAAIKQANEFMTMKHIDPAYKKLDEKLNAFWSEVHEKLLELKNKNNGN